jgi:hypothetical protein
MAVTLAQVLTTVDDALRRGSYEEKLGRVAEYDVTFCALDRVAETWKGNISYKVADALEIRQAMFVIDAESGDLRVFVTGEWEWEVKARA